MVILHENQIKTNEVQHVSNKKVLTQTPWLLCCLSNEPVHEISNNVVCATSKASDQPARMRSLIRAFASGLSMIVKLLTEHHKEFISLKGGYIGSPESTHVKMPH